MKTQLLYTLFGAAVLAILFLANSGGAGIVQQIDRTSSPLGEGSCATCHGGGSFNTSMTAQLLKGNDPVTQYEPGEDYTLRLTISAANGTPGGYGFQAVALRGDDNQNAGTWDSPPAGFRLTTLNNRQYVEQNSTRNNNVLEIKWEAPAAGSGSVRFYAAGNAVNRNGSTGGDSPATLDQPLVINEQSTTAVFDKKQLSATIKVYPNPVADQLNLRIQIGKSGRYFLSILDLSGREIQRQAVQLLEGDNLESLELTSLASGHYTVQLSDGERVAAVKMVKN